MKNPASEYAKSGVDIKASDKAKLLMKKLVEGTFNGNVIGGHGGFGGLYSIKELTGVDKILVGSTDSVGTKLKLAFMTGRHDTVGQDLVNHLVNDILCCGAKPMFFFDGFYNEGEYDLAGFIIGWVDKDRIIDGKLIKPGDKIIGLASSGLHTNGYSLARRAFFDIAGMKHGDKIEETGTEVTTELMKVHYSYLDVVTPLLDLRLIKGISHITGGGFEGNIRRIIPDGISAVIKTETWPVPGIFKAIQRIASVSDSEMYRVFNMGIGMVLVCNTQDSGKVISFIKDANIDVYEIGFCEKGRRRVVVEFG
ncbi:MAG: hypothetical protein B6D58_02305 [candidate division Zixibacteria bacterium 4484_95]|nr:MAG: hypothetical protein B6D58_02305 [candidate division Zixibacteria bacterium 4484_95]